MSEHGSRPEGVGEFESGVLPGQEENEGAGGGPPSIGDDGQSASDDVIALDELPEPEGDPVELDDLTEAQEEADALQLEQVRAELAEFSEPEGSPYEIEDDDSAGEDYEDEAETEDYEEAETEDYDYSDDHDEAADEQEAESDYEGAGDGE